MISQPIVALWISVIVIAALFIGFVAGLLAWIDSRRIARAVLVGGSAAGGAVALAVAVATVLI